MDITCCDIEIAVIGELQILHLALFDVDPEVARNLLLYTLLLDDDDGTQNDIIWKIYYHFRLDDKSYRLLEDQADKLVTASVSADSWRDGPYGKTFRFCDDASRLRVRATWRSYSEKGLSGEEKKSHSRRLQAAFQRAMDMRKDRVGNGEVMTGHRNTAPVSMSAMMDFPPLDRKFWETGVLTTIGAGSLKAKHLNPTMFDLGLENNTLHYGTNPLLGFHLAPAYASLAVKSPLDPKVIRSLQLSDLHAAAKVQFSVWGRSFRKFAQKNLTLRVFAGDAIAFCHTLQHEQSDKHTSANLYRDPWHFTPLNLDRSEYGSKNPAPTEFDVVDTSNLVDHMGALNILVATSSLLKGTLSSTLYIESLVRHENTVRALSDRVLCGDFSTISTLLGLFPVEYWTNASSVSTADETMLDSVLQMMNKGSNPNKQMRCRMAWKKAWSRATLASNTTKISLRFEEVELAQVLLQIYRNMFQHENVSLSMSKLSLQTLQNNSMPRYHRASLAAFLALVKQQVSVDWNKVMQEFCDLVEGDNTLIVGSNYFQELWVYLHIFDVYSVSTLAQPIRQSHHGDGDFRAWKDVPAISSVTVKVPRRRLELFSNIKPSELGTPPVHCTLESPKESLGRPWQNSFSAVQLAFGTLATSGNRHSNDFAVTVTEDSRGWSGDSALIVSFHVPTWILFQEPSAARVGFGVMTTPQTVQTFLKHLGMGMKFYETRLDDKENVFVSKFRPHQRGFPRVCSDSHDLKQPSNELSESIKVTVSSIVDVDNGSVKAFCGRLDIRLDDLKETLRSGAEVTKHQSSARNITIAIGADSLKHQLHFPTPVLEARAKLRIARKSSYVEVIAPVATFLDQDSFPDFVYPLFLDQSPPVSWAVPYLDLIGLPVLDLKRKKDLEWLNLHTTFMFSARERIMRETEQTGNDGLRTNVRLNYKESLFTMFMSVSGLQTPKRISLFALSDEKQGGIHIILIGCRLRLDLSNHTVVLEGAVLPLTKEIIVKIQTFLQATMIDTLQIKVDENELNLWKRAIPAYVERCRDWSHQPSCEYKRDPLQPRSLGFGEKCICSCGEGKFPKSFSCDVPKWNMIAKYATYIGISPLFSVPYVEDIQDVSKVPPKRVKPTSTAATSDINRCDNCRKDKSSTGKTLMRCARCHKVAYCSAECQRARWGQHKKICAT